VNPIAGPQFDDEPVRLAGHIWRRSSFHRP
jgi:hypothetical protein